MLKLILLACFVCAVHCAKHSTMDTRFGLITGAVEESYPHKRPYRAWYSIPYADPPVGPLRLKPPTPLPGWGVPGLYVVDGTKPPPICPQWNFRNAGGLQSDPLVGQEDCLYINIYVPGEVRTKELKPVMVFIHGGAFLGGSGNPDFYGPQHFMDEGSVILVTFNYRLGPLGFLTMEDDTLAGNLGIKDQNLALKWIQENIDMFEGDKNQVTIFGESAGGISVMDHVISPWSKGLFHRAIAQSGPVIDIPALHFEKSPSHYGREFAKAVGCQVDTDSEKLLQCLQEVPLETLMDKGRMFEKFLFMPNPWKPVVDSYAKKPFIKEDPKYIMEKNEHNQVPLIIGANADEGCLYLMQFLLNEEKLQMFVDDRANTGAMFLYGTDGEKDGDTQLEVKLAGEHLRFYVPDGNLELANRKSVQDMLTDVVFNAPTDTEAKILQEKHKEDVYYYNYRYRGQASLPDLYGYDQEKYGDMGVCHGDDLFIFFKNAMTKTDVDQKTTRRLIRMWTHFAKTGKPDSTGAWQPLAKGDKEPKMAILDGEKVRMAQGEETYRKRMEFTQGMLDKLRKGREEKKRRKDEL